MLDKRIFLLGTVHVDMQGPRRLEGILKAISPDVIALEFNKDAENLIDSMKTTPEKEQEMTDKIIKETKLKLTPEQRNTLLKIGEATRFIPAYELRTCRKYVQEKPKTKLEYIDISFLENGEQEFVKGAYEILKEQIIQISGDRKLRKHFLDMLSKGKDYYIEKSQEAYDMLYQDSSIIENVAEMMSNPIAFNEYKKQLRKDFPENAEQVLNQIYNPKRDEFMSENIRKLYNEGSNSVVSVNGLAHLPGLMSRLLDLKPIPATLIDYECFPNKI
jgi:pheromone shutdown protein TraB